MFLVQLRKVFAIIQLGDGLYCKILGVKHINN